MNAASTMRKASSTTTTQSRRQGTNARIEEATRQVRREQTRSKLIGNAKTATIRATIGIALASLAATAIGLGWKVATDPRWTGLRAIEIRGMHRHSPQEIAALSGLVFGKDLVHMDVAKATNALLSDPWIRDVSVSRLWPHRVSIQVSERIPVAALDSRRWISVDGKILVRRGDADLPRLSSRGFPAGLVPARSLSAVLSSLERMSSDGVSAPAQATVLRDGSMALDMGTGGPLLLLRPEDGRRALARWLVLRRELGERTSLFSEIDLRHGSCAALRRAEGGV